MFQGTVSGENRRHGGWLEPKYNYYSWALSSLMLREQYPKVELITDKMGKQLLVDCMKLPYSKVSVELDFLDQYPTDLWALGKIVSYAMQRSGFIHVDSDIFILERFSRKIERASLIAQNAEHNLEFYSRTIDELKQNNFHLPSFMESNIHGTRQASNAGIFGGNDNQLFKNLEHEVFTFIEQNQNRFSRLSNLGMLNPFLEQLMFQSLVTRDNKKVTYYLDGINPDDSEMVLFHLAPFRSKRYIHVYSRTLKNDANVVRNVELMLHHRYPKVYFRLNSLLRDWKIC